MRDPTPITKVKVLVADAEKMIADTLTLILNKAGFDARGVYSGEAASQAVSDFQPNVLITDVSMTGMTGMDAAITVASQHPLCKVLLVSAQAATGGLVQDSLAQVHTFEIMAKPVHPLQILSRLKTGPFNTPLSLIVSRGAGGSAQC